MISILNIPIHSLTKKQAAKKFADFCSTKNQHYAATPNAEILLESEKNPQLKSFLQSSSLNTADSVSLLWASMYLGKKWSKFRAVMELLFLPIRKKSWKEFLPEQVCGSDLIYDICEEAERQKRSIFLLGGMGDVAQRSSEVLLKKYPRLKIRGVFSGSPFEKGDKETLSRIKKANPDILVVCYGCPSQELWIQRNLKKCPSVKAAIGLGGTFDFLSGNIKRAPKPFHILGVEWLWRLMIQPSRWKRIFRAVFVFPLHLLWSFNSK